MRHEDYTVNEQVAACLSIPVKGHHLLDVCQRTSGIPVNCGGSTLDSKYVLNLEIPTFLKMNLLFG